MMHETLVDQVKVEQGTLFVRKDLLGRFHQQGDWYDTGDRVTLLSNQPLTFTIDSRDSDVISVGGFDVNVHEVEDTLRSLPGIHEARVSGQPNSVVGNILIAEIERSSPDQSEPGIRALLAGRLQPFKIPRIMTFMDELEPSAAGKLRR